MKPPTDSELKAHIEKLRAIHGDEPIRIKIAAPWAVELLATRRILDDLMTAIEYHWSFDNGQQHTHSWHDKQDFMNAWRAKIALLRTGTESKAGGNARTAT